MADTIEVRQWNGLSVGDLQAAADEQRQQATDLSLPRQVRQTAADQAAVLSALARVRLYEAQHGALRDAKLPEAQQELQAALQGGEAGHRGAVLCHEYGQRPNGRQLTGYVGRYSARRVQMPR